MKTSFFLGGLLLVGVFTAGCGDDSGGGGGAGGEAATSSTTGGTTTGGTTSSTTGGSTTGSTTSTSTGDGGATSTSTGEGAATSSSSGDGGAGGGSTATSTATSTGTGGSGNVAVVDCGAVDPVLTIATVGLAFDPAQVTIAPGDVVRFTPLGFHNMTADDDSWSSGEASDTACLQFNAAGLYPYHCSVHGLGMAGTVTVE